MRVGSLGMTSEKDPDRAARMSAAPRLSIVPGPALRESDAWRVPFRIANEGSGALRVRSSWLPHGRFRGDEREHQVEVAPGASESLDLVARSTGTPGEVVENVFLILRTEQDGARWRVLARLTIRFDESARPRPEVAVITSQPVGFSGVEDDDAARRA